MSTDVAMQDGRLKAATGPELTEQLHLLFASMELRAGADPQTALTGYLIALQGSPQWALANAVRRFLRGEVKGASKKFCPRPPEIAEAVQDELGHVYKELDEQREAEADRARKQAYIEARKAAEEQFPPEHRRRMGFKLSILSAGLSRRNVERVAEANARGMDAMIDLAREWSVPIPEELIMREAAE